MKKITIIIHGLRPKRGMNWIGYKAHLTETCEEQLGVRSFDLRRTRYLGLAKTHLQHILIACAINLSRLAHWIQGDVPIQAHATAFTRLFQPVSA